MIVIVHTSGQANPEGPHIFDHYIKPLDSVLLKYVNQFSSCRFWKVFSSLARLLGRLTKRNVKRMMLKSSMSMNLICYGTISVSIRNNCQRGLASNCGNA